ncbi:hypothetical protein IQ249_23835 [Lusitaniella coriacea LEGE 07157]|uniref:Uncharacterized protein n=1 Tax=Lusitaniella coriacea LEGE 07157 TaxID=945747 RepID=A0A8J7J6T8_9CYAN|nr:hypothetical protein [Lusitaniella coriacea]MBE9118924.1 hypothetical protein [Lusitaniella coriacea LEGE 07157]
MASFQHLLKAYRPYRAIALYSIAASSLFEIIDLIVPYAIGQILNVLSREPLDAPLQTLTHRISTLTNLPEGQSLSLGDSFSVFHAVHPISLKPNICNTCSVL